MGKFYDFGINSGKFNIPAAIRQPSGKWVNTKAYSVWSTMLKRCFTSKQYADISVSGEWRDFQDFAVWYNSRPPYQLVNNWELDKDILFKGNKEYSPSACRLVPKHINVAMKTSKNNSVSVGTRYHKRDKLWCAHIRYEGVQLDKSGFETEYHAFLWYKSKKIPLIRALAEKHKENLDAEIYQSLMNYDVKFRENLICP